MKIKIKELEALIKKVLLTKYNKEETNLIIPVVMFGELSETKSHGIIRICTTGENILNAKKTSQPTKRKVSPVFELIDGNRNPGMLIGAFACNDVIKLANKTGIGVVGTRSSSSSSGCLTYYVEKIAKEGLVGIVLARAPSDVAPFGGIEKLFGTNPIAFGIPATKNPLVFDMATSAVTYGAVARAKALNQNIPENVAIDVNGKMTTDPVKALEGAFLTFDNSYKGFGLNMMVEILAGILPGADFLNMGVGKGWGQLFLAISPKMFGSNKTFKNRVSTLIERVRNSKSTDGKKIRIPGEGKISKRNESVKLGWLDIDDRSLNDIKTYLETNGK